MLDEIMKEWETASNNAIKVEDKMNADGITFEFRKSVVKFMDTDIEIITRRRPGSGLAKDAELDPSKGPKYLVTIFVPKTGKILENIPSDSICPKTERMVAIMQALDVQDHDALVKERIKLHVAKQTEVMTAAWMKQLEGTDFSDAEKALFIEHAKLVLGTPIIKYRAGMFINIMAKYHKQIIGTDLEACGIKLSDKWKPDFTFTDVMFDLTCQCLDRQVTNSHNDNLIPIRVVENFFWDTEKEATNKMGAYLRTARATLRGIYTDCNERQTTLAYILNGMAKYYEVTTGESVQLRMARIRDRRKKKQEAKTQAEIGTKPKKQRKTEQIQIFSTGGSGMCCLGDILREAGIKD